MLVSLLVIAVASVAVWQRENIKAFIDSRTRSTEDITADIEQSKHVVEEVISQYDVPITRDFTLEEEDKIRRGELSVEEAMALIMTPAEENTDSTDTRQSASENGNAQANVPSQASAPAAVTADSILANYLGQLYSLKAYYIGQLGRVEGEMRSVYATSGRDKTAIAGIVQNYLPEIGSLEGECDSKVAALISNMRAELKAIGADTSIADKIYDAYINEKASKKAYYLSMY